MSVNLFLVIILSLTIREILSEERFCAKDRKLLLGGVFNYDNFIFGYSWKEVHSVQLWLVWKFEVKGNKIIAVGQDIQVDQLFPGLPLFRAGFGLTMKCKSTDSSCNSYRQLVFIFFQTSYKTYRYTNDKFTPEADKTKIPWGIKPKGEVIDWYFGSTFMDNINAIMFLSGYQSQIFIVSKSILFVASVNIKSPSLKWTKLSETRELFNTLGGFVVGSQLFINRNEAPDSILMKYESSGKQSEQINVWKYFSCDNEESDGTNKLVPSQRINPLNEWRTAKDRDDNLAIILLISIVIVIVLTDIFVAIFWFTIYRKSKNPSNI